MVTVPKVKNKCHFNIFYPGINYYCLSEAHQIFWWSSSWIYITWLRCFHQVTHMNVWYCGGGSLCWRWMGVVINVSTMPSVLEGSVSTWPSSHVVNDGTNQNGQGDGRGWFKILIRNVWGDTSSIRPGDVTDQFCTWLIVVAFIVNKRHQYFESLFIHTNGQVSNIFSKWNSDNKTAKSL